MLNSEVDSLPPGLGGPSRDDRPRRLHELLHGARAVIVPGVVDALGARLVEQAGFAACYVTGAGIANAQLGLPDVGLLSLSETADYVARIADATSLPVIADADTGFGGPISVMRTVHLYERAGAAGIQIEDQVIPKRCGHFSGKRLVSTEEMLAKIDAARLARRNPHFAIIARTDARAVLGFEAALERARAYANAGADAIFVEAPESVEELRRIPRELGSVPLVVNIVEGGLTPQLPASELEALGYRVILHANLLLRAMLRAGQQALAYLREHGESDGLQERIVSWQERQALVNLEQVDALEDQLSARWNWTS